MKIDITKTIPVRINTKRIIQTAAFAMKKMKKKGRVHIVFVSESEMSYLNSRYRRKNRPTDVLSFTYNDEILGEIIICYSVARSDANALNISLAEEIDVLVVHGILHLLGFNHKKQIDAVTMEGLEKEIHKGLK